MAIKMKDIGSLATKFSTRAQASVPEYKLGIQNPKHDQMASAIAAAPVWAQAVADAAARNAFATGLQKAGPNKWSTNALNLGSQRYPQGVANAMPAWQSGFQPFYTVISNLTLPPRGLRRSPQNLQRVAAVDNALAAAKTGKAA